jgi:hypothetical protein
MPLTWYLETLTMHQESLTNLPRVATWLGEAKVLKSPITGDDAQLSNRQAESDLLLYSKVGLRLGQIVYKHGKFNALPPH